MSTDFSPRVRRILAELGRVDAIRAGQWLDSSLPPRVQALKAFQHQRFRHTYQDFLINPRYEKAACFFLEELYGPGDFSGRDAQFARVVPALVRLFPVSVVDTVELLSELHALSEVLDDAMARAVSRPVMSMADYASAWSSVQQLDSRQRQLSMVLALGRQLDRLTQNRLMRQSLRWMRPAARAAGLEKLQQFLERGFDGFSAMQGSEEFLAIIASREQQFITDMQSARDIQGIAG
ncbi:hypothetical protein BurJ1DRAFT_0475 [Burkholderiales bacterium JOSHI_001]|nr:hypothetical protein BurJ1DRAFT_0475 [Burkholderiales bacterium JOSHI_001]